DQKRKHRHQDRQRDVACDRPAVIGVKAIQGIQSAAPDPVDRIQRQTVSAPNQAMAFHSIVYGNFRSSEPRPCPPRLDWLLCTARIRSLGAVAAATKLTGEPCPLP